MKTKPLNNNALVEVQRDYDGVSRTDDNESMKYGMLVDFHITNMHLTASAALKFDSMDYKQQYDVLKELMGKIVRWEEFAEGGQTFEEDGKTYALIPWWRLIGYSENKETK